MQISLFVPFFFRLDISDVIWYLSFSIWFTSLSMPISSFIHVAANGIILFFFYGWVILGFRLWWSKLPCRTGPHDKELRANSIQNQWGAKALHSVAHESPGDNWFTVLYMWMIQEAVLPSRALGCLWTSSWGIKSSWAIELLVAQLVNNPPVMWETWVLSLG